MARSEERTLSRHLAGLLLFLLLAWSQLDVAGAHGGGDPRLQAEPVGPYRLFVWVQPSPPQAGEYHVTVALTEALPDDPTGLNGPPVFDADIQVRLVHQESGQTLEAVATHEGADNPVFYEARIQVPRPGTWTIHIQVEGPMGTGEASYVEAFAPAPFPWRTWALGGGALLAVVGGLGLWFRGRGGPARSARRSATEPSGALPRR